MYIKEIKDMINLMNENNLTELEIEKEGVRIRLKKGSAGYERAVEFVQPQAAPPAAPQEKAAVGAEKVDKRNVFEIKAPMVGTFYRAASPEAPPYVNIGDMIDVGQVVCIIEAMKLMNEIKSEVKGKVVDIQVDNAEPVEFGQVLFLIEPSS
ncbi:MAG: acetyl-CoA carboxylase biotin carboxyl carrier protein [Candidatus Omnitrophica bacterium]|nr:acetyl-CoA carboxylase biotin carboxyl carrier protein [Candidatus Omnitrophota bacterium]